jgi:drug/metabolite transporter (DMT)-like permease
MFYLLAIFSVIGYSVQSVLAAHHARKLDGLSMVVYRHATLAISLLPLLLFVDWVQVDWAVYPWFDLLWASLAGVTSSALSFQALKSLPVAISRTVNRGISVPVSFLLGALFFAEIPTLSDMLVVSVMIGGIIMLSREQISFPHLDNRFWHGIGLTALAAIFSATTFFFIAKVSRATDPFLSGYLWEILMGPIALLFVGVRQSTGFGKLKKIDWKTFKQILIVCSPTLIGTGCFVMASRLGSLGILSAISSVGLVFGLVLAHWLYHEKLNQRQIAWISFVLLCLLGLKLL